MKTYFQDSLQTYTALNKGTDSLNAFGMVMPERSFSSESYRYGFNGKENDNEVKGVGNSVDFGARIYDSRLGRWLSTDPLQNEYPGMSPYNAMGDNPVLCVDNDGRKITVSTITNKDGSLTVLVRVDAKMINLTSTNDPSLVKSIHNQIEGDISSVIRGQYENQGVKVNYEVSVNITEIQSEKEIQKDDHVIAIVDDIPKGNLYDDNGNQLDPIALTNESGNVMLVEESTAKKTAGKRTFTHEFGHWLGLSDDYTKKSGGDSKKLMNNKGGSAISDQEKKIMFNQFTGAENKSKTKAYRNANKSPLGSGDSKTELKGMIDDGKVKAKHR